MKAQWEREYSLSSKYSYRITHEFCKVYSIPQIFGVFNNVVQNLNICYIRTHLGNTSFSTFEISLLKKFLSNFNSKILRYVFSSNLFSIFNLVRTLSLLIFPRYSFSRNFILQTSKHLLLSFNFSSRMKEIKKIYFTKYFPFSSSKLLINQNYNQ